MILANMSKADAETAANIIVESVRLYQRGSVPYPDSERAEVSRVVLKIAAALFEAEEG